VAGAAPKLAATTSASFVAGSPPSTLTIRLSSGTADPDGAPLEGVGAGQALRGQHLDRRIQQHRLERVDVVGQDLHRPGALVDLEQVALEVPWTITCSELPPLPPVMVKVAVTP